MEKVTAIITTYNREANIVMRALSSIEAQTYPIFEKIVVDDNKLLNQELSSLSVSLRDTIGDRAVYIKQPLGNAGANAARNLGIKNAHGDYIAFLDDDDEWLPDKIQKQISIFQATEKPNLGLVFCGGICRVQMDNGEKREYDYFNLKYFMPSPTHMDILRDDRIGSTSQPLIRKGVFSKVGGFDENLPARQDYDMWIRISKQYEVIGIYERLFIHNLHEKEQISKSKKRSYIAFSKLYSKYQDEYKRDPMAFFNIQYYIALNQEGIIGRIRLYLVRFIRKLYMVMEKQ